MTHLREALKHREKYIYAACFSVAFKLMYLFFFYFFWLIFSKEKHDDPVIYFKKKHYSSTHRVNFKSLMIMMIFLLIIVIPFSAIIHNYSSVSEYISLSLCHLIFLFIIYIFFLTYVTSITYKKQKKLAQEIDNRTEKEIKHYCLALVYHELGHYYLNNIFYRNKVKLLFDFISFKQIIFPETKLAYSKDSGQIGQIMIFSH